MRDVEIAACLEILKALDIPLTEAEQGLETMLAILHRVQRIIKPGSRTAVANAIAKAIERTVPREATRNAGAAEGLVAEGYKSLGQVFRPGEIAAVLSHLRTKPCFNAHVPALSDGVGRLLGDGADQFHYGSYRLSDVITAPHLMELANSPMLIDLASDYLGCAPTLYSVHAWWSFAGHGQASIAQEFHRDADDYRFCTLFVFLTDVGMSSGAHAFIRRTHRYELQEDDLRTRGAPLKTDALYVGDSGGRDAFYAEIFASQIETITGPAGYGFVVDTAGLHKGIPLTTGNRLMFWARYGLYRNTTYFNDKLAPVANPAHAAAFMRQPYSAYINRGLIAES
jgi:hypothetical protein